VEETAVQNEPGGTWTLLTGHGHVLVAIAREPQARLRDISTRVGLTERAVQLIVADLVAAGYLIRHRVGRRNHYTVNLDSPFRHPDQDGHRVGPFLDLLATAGKPSARMTPSPSPPAARKTAGRHAATGHPSAPAAPATDPTLGANARDQSATTRARRDTPTPLVRPQMVP
jgi:hypothetical protein